MDVEITIVNALRVAADSFDDHAKAAREAAKAPPHKRRAPYSRPDGTRVVDCTPSPKGYACMALAFEAQALQVRALADDIAAKGIAVVMRDND